MTHLGLNVYCWGQQEQNRLLADGLGPVAREVRDQRLARRFWFTRFDVRGPHIFAVFTPSPESSRSRLAEVVSARLEAYLDRHPSQVVLERAELEERHAACRGKSLCAADQASDFAPNNSFALVDHATWAYPFRWSAHLAAHEELWRQLDASTFWALEELTRGRQTAAGIRWLAAVDLALAPSGHAAESYWRYHACTLVLPLTERLERAEEEVTASLPAAVGARNREIFSSLWNDVAETGAPEVERWLALVLADDSRSERQRWSLLREINHSTLAQLGLPVKLQIPLVLYAWLRHLTLGVAA